MNEIRARLGEMLERCKHAEPLLDAGLPYPEAKAYEDRDYLLALAEKLLPVVSAVARRRAAQKEMAGKKKLPKGCSGRYWTATHDIEDTFDALDAEPCTECKGKGKVNAGLGCTDWVTCPVCHPEAYPEPCKRCGGKKEVPGCVEGAHGYETVFKPCPDCGEE